MAPAQRSPASSATSLHLKNETTKQPLDLNPPAPDIPYFTPSHAIAPGTALGQNDANKSIPTLFTPLTIRSKTLKNRIVVSPMCQYSTSPVGPSIGCLTPYHIATLGHYALKGAGLVFVEATAVQFSGRISPNCPGLWSDAQIDGVKAVADFVHSQGGVLGIQLAHAGRKASVAAPWIASAAGVAEGKRRHALRATKDVGGWGQGGVVGPMGGADWVWDGKADTDPEGGYWEPRGLTTEEVKQLVEDFKAAAVRAVRAGVDLIEIHGAHGYLIHQFLSPVTNQRTDIYGGSFENRTRLLKEIITGVRSVIPEGMPVFVRLSGTEWLEGSDVEKAAGGSWDVESTIKVSKLLPEWGADLLDVSSGGNHYQQNTSSFHVADYQTKIAGRVRQELKKEGKSMFIGAVGLITEAEQARDLVEEVHVDANHAVNSADESSIAEEARAAKDVTDTEGGKEPKADVVLIARQFLREPEWVLRVAAKLGVEVAWPSQFLRVRFPKL